jgi:hypothetical protein
MLKYSAPTLWEPADSAVYSENRRKIYINVRKEMQSIYICQSRRYIPYSLCFQGLHWQNMELFPAKRKASGVGNGHQWLQSGKIHKSKINHRWILYCFPSRVLCSWINATKIFMHFHANSQSKVKLGRALAQTVSSSLPTTAAQVQTQVRSCGFCGTQCGT